MPISASMVQELQEKSPESILLYIENFQSIKEAMIPLDGLTVLTGPSNNGKSVVFRALRAVLENVWPSTYLRHGTTQCKVILVFPRTDEHEIDFIKYIKGKTKNEYSVYYRDGRQPSVYPKIGRNIPDEIQNIGFAQITSERGDVFSPIFQPQHSYFMLNNTPTVFTSLLNTVFKVGRYEAAVKKVFRDIQKLQERDGEVAVLESQKESEFKRASITLNNMTEELNGLVAIQTRVHSARTSLNNILSGFSLFNSIDSCKQEQQTEKDVILKSTSDMSHLEALESTLTKFLSSQEALDGLRSLDNSLSTERKSVLEATESISTVDLYHTALSKGIHHKDAQAKVTTLSNLTALQKTEREIIQQSDESTVNVNRLGKSIMPMFRLSQLSIINSQQSKERSTVSALSAKISGLDKCLLSAQSSLNNLKSSRSAMATLSSVQSEVSGLNQSQTTVDKNLEIIRKIGSPIYRFIEASGILLELETNRAGKERGKQVLESESLTLKELDQSRNFVLQTYGICPLCSQSTQELHSH